MSWYYCQYLIVYYNKIIKILVKIKLLKLSKLLKFYRLLVRWFSIFWKLNLKCSLCPEWVNYDLLIFPANWGLSCIYSKWEACIF